MINYSRCSAAFINLIASMVLVGSMSWIIWHFWYPDEYFEISGGGRIVMLLIAVNIFLGPIATFMTFDVKKTERVLKSDVRILLILQVGALIYGLSVAADARPVALVFAKDRFTLISANEIRLTELRRLKSRQVQLPWAGGPMLFSIRTSVGDEALDAVVLASDGFDLPFRPSYWQSYGRVASDAFHRSRPLAALIDHYRLTASDFQKSYLKRAGASQAAVFLPLESKRGEWVIVLDADGFIAGFAPFNGFF